MLFPHFNKTVEPRYRTAEPVRLPNQLPTTK